MPDSHDDTARIATGQDLDPRWQAHLGYLRDLQRVARGLLAHAGAPACVPADPARECFGISGLCPIEYQLTS
jgi:hypothetical protein